MGRIEKTVKNASWGLITKLINILILFGGRTVFIHTLGEQYLGISSLFTSILTVLSLAELGFAEAITYNLYKPIVENDTNKIAETMRYFKKIYQVIGVTIFVLGMAVIPFLDLLVKDVPNIKENITIIYILYVINSAMSYFYVYKSILLEASQQKYIISIVNTIVATAKTILNCIILIVTKNIIAYLIIEIVSTIAYNIIISKITQNRYKEIFETKVDLPKEERKGIINNVKALFFYKVAGVFLTSTDNLIINTFVGTVIVGKYSNYTLITTQLYSFILQIFNATTASIGNLAASEETDKQHKVFLKIIFFGFVIYCISTTMLWVLINPFVNTFWGNEYVLEKSTVIMVIIAYYLVGHLSIITNFRTTNGLFTQGKYRPILMAIINIVVSLLLVKPLGLNGVLLGTIFARAVTQMWYDPYLVYTRVFKKSVKEYFIISIKYILITLGCCVLTTYVTNLFNLGNSGILRLIINAVFSFAISVTAIVAIYRKSEEFKYFISIAKTYFNKAKKRFGKGDECDN